MYRLGKKTCTEMVDILILYNLAVFPKFYIFTYLSIDNLSSISLFIYCEIICFLMAHFWEK